MKMNKIQAMFIIVLVGLIVQAATAQKEYPLFTEEETKGGSVFTGQIQNFSKEEFSDEDYVYVIYKGDVKTVYTTYGQSTEMRTIHVPIAANGEFQFRLPPVNKIGAFYIYLRKGSYKMKDSLLETSNLMKLSKAVQVPYYYENNDSIHINIKVYSPEFLQSRFTGEGAAKYRLLNDAALLFSLRIGGDFFQEVYTDEENLETHLNHLNVVRKTREELLAVLFKNYENKVSPDVLELMKITMQAKIANELLYRYQNLYSQNQFKEVIKRSYEAHFPPVTESSFNTMALSKDALNYLTQRTKFEYRITNNNDEFTTPDIYYALKRYYSNLLGEKLQAAYLLSAGNRFSENNTSPSQYDDCLKDAYKSIQTPFLKNLIGYRLHGYTKGSQAVPFALPDTAGKIHKLEDFRGKIVFLDIYGTICTGCRIIAKTLKSGVFQEFEDNEDVVFIAISTEKDKDRWLLDLEEGNNACKEHEVNLYSDGMGMEHPYFKRLNILAVPTLFLIDREGKVINSSAHTLNSGVKKEALINMIYEALDAGKEQK